MLLYARLVELRETLNGGQSGDSIIKMIPKSLWIF